MNPVFIIPVYNHRDVLESLVDELVSYDLPGIIVNDGSNQQTREVIETIDDRFSQVDILHREENGGKGAAVKTGFEYAEACGYTHAILIDADGQHDASDVPAFLDSARDDPDALILGDPEFDESVPASRYYGRKISRFWVWVETISMAIRDPLFGFRCYPISRTLDIIRREGIGKRMEFDPEIAVRFYWNGGTIKNIRTAVQYFPDRLSNFNFFTDNIRISWMHCRLFFGMWLRLPYLFRRSMFS